MLVTTATANKLIADVWFARADFAKDNPDIIEGLVARHLRRDGGPEGAGRQAEGREADGRRLFDSRERRARHARRRALDQLRREPRVLPEPEQPDQLRAHLEHRVLPLQEDQRGHRADAVRSGDGLLGHPEARRASRSTRARRTSTTCSSRRRPPASIQGEKDEILTKTVVIHFFPNSWDLNKKVTRDADGKDVEELYDPNVGFVVEEIGKLAGQYGAARIVIEGHTDGSMKGQVPKSAGPGAVAQPRERGEGSDRPEVPVAAAEPVLDRRAWAGTARRIRAIRTTTRRTGASRSRSTRRRRAGRQVDGRRDARPSLFALRVPPPRMTRRLLGVGGGGVRRAALVARDDRRSAPRTGSSRR